VFASCCQQGLVGRKNLLQQNHLVLDWGCWLLLVKSLLFLLFLNKVILIEQLLPRGMI